MGPLVCWRGCAYALAAAIVMFPLGADAAERRVHTGEDLQAVLDAAQPGDTILLEAGATFRGNFVLGVKTGSDYITIRTDVADALLPGSGSRITPAHSPYLAKLESPNVMPSLRTAAGAHHWRLMLLEVGPTQLGVGEIIRLGEGWLEQSLLAQVPHHIELDRLYIHGHPLYGQKRGIALNGAAITIRNCWIADIKSVGFDSQAIAGWNGPGPVLIENNYLEAAGENVLFGGSDPAIDGLITEDIVVRRNYVTRPLAWRNPIIPTPQGLTATATSGSLPAATYAYRVVARRAVGGSTVGRSTASAEARLTTGGGVRLTWTAVPDAEEYVVYGRGRAWVVTTPSFTDTGTGGTTATVPTTPGDVWQVKNLFELKNARRVVVENNIFEHNWKAAQPGYAILFTVRNQDGGCTWCVVSDVRFEYNVVRHVTAGINILGYDSPHVSAQTHAITIRHNLFTQVQTALGGNGWFLLLGDAPREVIVDHNTVDHNGTTAVYAYGGTATSPKAIYGFQFTNNAMRHGSYGINGASFSTGTTTLAAYFPDAVVKGNWLSGGSASRYPAGNYFTTPFETAFVDVSTGDYRPAPGSLLLGAATDGTNIGADVATLFNKVAGVVEGTPASTSDPSAPAPAPEPAPEPEPEPEPVPAPPTASDDVVLQGASAAERVGRWTIVSDSTAIGGAAIWHPNAGAPKITTALANPADYFELTFDAVAGKPYRVWLHGKADNDYWGNDSVFVQFSDSVTDSGAAIYRIGTTSGADVNLESCGGCGVSGWMWQDNGYGQNVLGPAVYFATTGQHTMRVQTREDGLRIDLILLSPSTYLTAPPGISPQ
jgi:hypothetical protein